MMLFDLPVDSEHALRLCPCGIPGGRCVYVVQHHLIEGGTKALVLPWLLRSIGSREYVYASPSWGYAQHALAVAGKSLGVKVHVHIPARGELSVPSELAAGAGAVLHQHRPGYLNVVQKRAADFAFTTGARLLPFGLQMPAMREGLVAVVRMVTPQPDPGVRVWVAAGSGTLYRALREAWPTCTFGLVQVGKPIDRNDIRECDVLYVAPEKFEQQARGARPPMPSAVHYDAKVWRYVLQHAEDGDLFWNVAG